MKKTPRSYPDSFESEYGYFSKNGAEYVITRPDPPRPWYNHLGHAGYAIRFSQTGGGYSRCRPPDGNLINPLGSFDRPGKYVYIRDNATGEFWSANVAPVMAGYDSFRCTHGLGYSEIESLHAGIRSSFHIFVPLADPVEIWGITLKNESRRRRSIAFFPFMELCLAGYTIAYDMPISSSWVRYWPDEKLLLAEYVHLHSGTRFAWFARPLFEVDGYDGRREDFIGPCNDYSRPVAVVENQSACHEGYHDYLVAAFRKEICLRPGESRTFRLLAGVSESDDARFRLITRYSKASDISRALRALATNWKRRCDRVVIRTPDEGINLYANVWLKSAVDACVTWVRGPASNSNFGYRDVLQDAKGIVKFDPTRTRENILRALPYQFKDGSALRQWAADPAYHDRRKFADSPLWLSFTICAYIRETGDRSILDAVRQYLDGGEATAYGHLLAGLRKISGDLGRHGLPRIWEGDWNDGIGGMGARGEGESVWLAMAVVAANREAAKLAAFIGDTAVEQELNAYNERIAAAINGAGWDDNWYRRGFTDKGRPVGTTADDEVTLWLNTQVWALLAGVADPERTTLIRRIVEERLKTPVGYILFDPPFKRFRPDIGYYSNLIPRQWVYMHSNAFKFAAECATGFGDAAYETLSLILPVNHDPAKTAAEPYAFPNYYVTEEPERMGRSMFGWFTATCSWIFTSIVEGLVGIKPDYDGLRIEPCIPRNWKELSAEVDLRGARYAVRIRNPNGRETGVLQMTIDGKKTVNPVIPYFQDGRKHRIDVEL
jgi:cellobiose phosphorylase